MNSQKLKESPEKVTRVENDLNSTERIEKIKDKLRNKCKTTYTSVETSKAASNKQSEFIDMPSLNDTIQIKIELPDSSDELDPQENVVNQTTYSNDEVHTSQNVKREYTTRIADSANLGPDDGCITADPLLDVINSLKTEKVQLQPVQDLEQNLRELCIANMCSSEDNTPIDDSGEENKELKTTVEAMQIEEELPEKTEYDKKNMRKELLLEQERKLSTLRHQQIRLKIQSKFPKGTVDQETQTENSEVPQQQVPSQEEILQHQIKQQQLEIDQLKLQNAKKQQEFDHQIKQLKLEVSNFKQMEQDIQLRYQKICSTNTQNFGKLHCEIEKLLFWLEFFYHDSITKKTPAKRPRKLPPKKQMQHNCATEAEFEHLFNTIFPEYLLSLTTINNRDIIRIPQIDISYKKYLAQTKQVLQIFANCMSNKKSEILQFIEYKTSSGIRNELQHKNSNKLFHLTDWINSACQIPATLPKGSSIPKEQEQNHISSSIADLNSIDLSGESQSITNVNLPNPSTPPNIHTNSVSNISPSTIGNAPHVENISPPQTEQGIITQNSQNAFLAGIKNQQIHVSDGGSSLINTAFPNMIQRQNEPTTFQQISANAVLPSARNNQTNASFIEGSHNHTLFSTRQQNEPMVLDQPQLNIMSSEINHQQTQKRNTNYSHIHRPTPPSQTQNEQLTIDPHSVNVVHTESQQLHPTNGQNSLFNKQLYNQENITHQILSTYPQQKGVVLNGEHLVETVIRNQNAPTYIPHNVMQRPLTNEQNYGTQQSSNILRAQVTQQNIASQPTSIILHTNSSQNMNNLSRNDHVHIHQNNPNQYLQNQNPCENYPDNSSVLFGTLPTDENNQHILSQIHNPSITQQVRVPAQPELEHILAQQNSIVNLSQERNNFSHFNSDCQDLSLKSVRIIPTNTSENMIYSAENPMNLCQERSVLSSLNGNNHRYSSSLHSPETAYEHQTMPSHFQNNQQSQQSVNMPNFTDLNIPQHRTLGSLYSEPSQFNHYAERIHTNVSNNNTLSGFLRPKTPPIYYSSRQPQSININGSVSLLQSDSNPIAMQQKLILQKSMYANCNANMRAPPSNPRRTPLRRASIDVSSLERENFLQQRNNAMYAAANRERLHPYHVDQAHRSPPNAQHQFSLNATTGDLHGSLNSNPYFQANEWNEQYRNRWPHAK
ncbi:probable cyclin-dependent serine/threonine-protein kinase DDB_G0292550 [Teleopsis dalmanni]|uniref:probable cyclin-dependent serine/threonine-protein kinase DDB_G0292550 n=1 Tax=Teleopsis dalmanni TaxID=139649 RepID=UPI0018CFA799|nr:probable cyclin-dependent serine/threonine-protein kinase DDB_G0292550 [Teleopsis dalmanni]